MVDVQVLPYTPRGPLVKFCAPPEQDETVLEALRKKLVDNGLQNRFNFRLKLGRIQVQRQKRKDVPSGPAWLLLGTEKILPLEGILPRE